MTPKAAVDLPRRWALEGSMDPDDDGLVLVAALPEGTLRLWMDREVVAALASQMTRWVAANQWRDEVGL